MTNCSQDIGDTGFGGSSNRNCGRSSVDVNIESRYDISTNPCTKLTFIHSNCQSAMNKASEISALVDEQKPHVLALTEFGAGDSVTDGELGIEGYTLYRGNHSSGGGGLGKGVAAYVANTLSHAACSKFDNEDFDCSTWITIKLSDNKTLLVGVVYRSPNSNDENNDRLISILRKAASIRCDFLMLCGDYNLPRINWNTNHCFDTDTSYSQAFLTTVEDLSLFQHATNPTRIRGEQQSCLDLIFTNEENMVEDVQELPPVGKSDHVCQKWSLVVDEVIFKNTTVMRPNFRRADWDSMKDDIKGFRINREDRTNDINDKFIAMIDETKSKNVPKCRPKSLKVRLPWMKKASIKKQRATKWRSWKTFKQTGLLREYDAYKFERNRLNDMIRTAKIKYEQGLIVGMKENPNLYHVHCRRSLKTKQGVSNVEDGSGKITKTEGEAAAALNVYYRTVFTADDGMSTPEFPNA